MGGLYDVRRATLGREGREGLRTGSLNWRLSWWRSVGEWMSLRSRPGE